MRSEQQKGLVCHCERSEAISNPRGRLRLLRRCAPRNDIPGRHMSLRTRLAERGNLPPIVAAVAALAKGRTRWQCPFLARGSCGKAPPPSPSCPARDERKYLTRERTTRKRHVAQPPPAVKTADDRLTSFDEQLRQWPAPGGMGLGSWDRQSPDWLSFTRHAQERKARTCSNGQSGDWRSQGWGLLPAHDSSARCHSCEGRNCPRTAKATRLVPLASIFGCGQGPPCAGLSPPRSISRGRGMPMPAHPIFQPSR